MDTSTWVPLVVAVLGFAGIYLQNRRSHEVTNKKVDKIEHSVNHVEEEPDPDGNGQITLGQVVKQIADTQGAHTDAIHQVGERVDVIRTDVDNLHTEFTGHIASESVERQEIAEHLAEKVEAVHDEVKTVDGHTIAALAENADARRIEDDIDKGDRTTNEQEAVDRLHHQGPEH